MTATAMGPNPTATVAVMVLLAVSSTETVWNSVLAMYANGAACAVVALSRSSPRKAAVNAPIG